MQFQINSNGGGYGRNEELETIYETMSYRENLTAYLKTLTEHQINELLLTENLDPICEEVIEELFGAKFAGAKAKLGAQASNLKNRVKTGVSNVGQKAGAMASNTGGALKGLGSRIMGNQAGIQAADAGLQDVSQVGNQQAQIQDPNLARNQAVLQSYAPQIQKTISQTIKKLNSDLASLGLDSATIQSIDPELAKSLSYAQGWLKAILTKLGKTQTLGGNQQPQQVQQPQVANQQAAPTP